MSVFDKKLFIDALISACVWYVTWMWIRKYMVVKGDKSALQRQYGDEAKYGAFAVFVGIYLRALLVKQFA